MPDFEMTEANGREEGGMDLRIRGWAAEKPWYAKREITIPMAAVGLSEIPRWSSMILHPCPHLPSLTCAFHSFTSSRHLFCPSASPSSARAKTPKGGISLPI